MNQPLQIFVYQALKKGIARDQIAIALGKGGWSPEEIHTALQSYVDTDLDLPVPRKSASTSPKEAFLFLLLFSTLFTWMFSLGSVTFDLLNLWLPLPGQGELVPHWITSLRSSIASVLVAFPLFIFIDHLTSKEACRNPGQRISPIRRWLTYLTLFAAASAIVSDLITLTLTFLEGELTLRFLLKVAVVAILAGSTFAYYLTQLRRDESEPSTKATTRGKGRLVLAGSVIVILLVAFWNAGSPIKARQYRQDEQRVRDLISIQSSLETFAKEKGHLPANLEACDENSRTFVDFKADAVTGQPYVYRILDATHAEIGATFSLPSPKNKKEWGFWSHDSGPVTFRLEVKLQSKE